MTESQAADKRVLTRFTSTATQRDLDKVSRLGVATSIGATRDAAYENPDAIERVFRRLHEGGVALQKASGPAHPYLSRTSALLKQVPVAPVANLGRRVSRSIHSRAERARASILYQQPDVMGWPWHVQGGRALALGTIVDAHDLDASGSPGPYKSMSGRLHSSVAEHTFGPNTGWLNGMTLRDALIESRIRFHGTHRPRAEAKTAQDLADLIDFATAPVEPGFKDIVAYCFDSLGIRSRKEEVRARIAEHVGGRDGDLLMLSIGCGTAQSMLEVLQDTVALGRNATLILLDQDPIALAAAEQLASQLGLHAHIEIRCERLIVGRGRRTRVLDLGQVLNGRLVDVCEDSGLREYFPGFLYRDLAAKAWASVKPGGLMTTGNMNVNRPQPEFLHGLMGWPIPVQMRSALDVVQEHLAVGVPADALQIRMTQDRVYVVCSAVKPDVARD